MHLLAFNEHRLRRVPLVSAHPQVPRLCDFLLHLRADALDVELVVPEDVGELRVLINEGPHLLLHFFEAHLGVLQKGMSVIHE